jgi:transposase
MKRSRRKFDSAFKAKVTIEALKEWKTLPENAVRYDLHPDYPRRHLTQWKASKYIYP